MHIDLYKFQGQLQSDGILFCFSGPVSQAILEGMGETLRQKMNLEETDLTTSQKIFSIFVEQMQNIINYSAERNSLSEGQGELGLGTLIVGKQGGQNYIMAGNSVLTEDEGILRGLLDTVKNLDKDGLKMLYKERRKGSAHSGSKGAGLGLIEMARKASAPLQYEFVPIDVKHSYFSVKVVI